jgi:hypothetical protein
MNNVCGIKRAADGLKAMEEMQQRGMGRIVEIEGKKRFEANAGYYASC